MATQSLSDKGLSILTFAAYHQLASGERVTEVALRDGAGHAANPDGVREVETLDLATIENDKAVFTDKGLTMIDSVLQQIRGTIKLAERETAVG